MNSRKTTDRCHLVWALALAMMTVGLWCAPAHAEDDPIVIAAAGRTLQVSRIIVEAFKLKHPEVAVTVQPIPSGPDVECLRQGTCSILALPRPVTRSEIPRIQQTRVHTPFGVPIAMDAVVFFVHPDNSLDAITLEQLRKIYSFEVRQWTEMGIDFPKLDPNFERRIARTAPPESLGTTDVFRARVFGGYESVRSLRLKKDMIEVVAEVSSIPLAIGLGPLGRREGVKVMALKRDDDAPAVLPTPENVRNRTYPLSHYLYWYVVGTPQGVARDLIRFATSPEGQRAVKQADIGFLPLPNVSAAK